VAETKPMHLRLSRHEWCLRHACFMESYFQRCYPSSFFVRRSWDSDVESLLTLMSFMPANNFCNLLYFSHVLDIVLDTK
jgi:hypothetical protein